ncbi:hypothetical protein JOB18_024128 [Solea senegalensis]|uniref:Uncharacterized protein n=1 Tax=Solea senegalensis TaxID=28829 RepID=A0AAV6S4A1_SOLSE|nr:hypothetical protein JOB18_024128 [Solea senegalensis]
MPDTRGTAKQANNSSQATLTQSTAKPSSDQVMINVVQAIRELKNELIAKIDQKAEAQSAELRTQIEVLQSEFKKANELAEARCAALEGRVTLLETAASEQSDTITVLEQESIDFETMVISDHCPVVMDISFPDNIAPQRTWRFNPCLLSNQDFVKYISNHIDLFMETNQDPQISKGCLWETLKAYLRGIIISFTASANKKNAKRLLEIEIRICAIDQEHALTPSENLYRERILLQTEYDIIMTERAEDLHRKSRLNYYESGERASKLLSHQLRQSVATSFITEIGLDNGGSTTEQKSINKQFQEFYKNLYKSEAVLSSFWLSVFDGISYVCKKRINPDPIMAIFGAVPEGITLSASQANMGAFVTLLARKLILVNWKSPNAPTHKRWLEEVFAHLKLEKLRYSSQGYTQKFFNVWQRFIDYFSEKCSVSAQNNDNPDA